MIALTAIFQEVGKLSQLHPSTQTQIPFSTSSNSGLPYLPWLPWLPWPSCSLSSSLHSPPFSLSIRPGMRTPLIIVFESRAIESSQLRWTRSKCSRQLRKAILITDKKNPSLDTSLFTAVTQLDCISQLYSNDWLFRFTAQPSSPFRQGSIVNG